MAAAISGGEADAEGEVRCLSIQSHVVHGMVGNRCAALALQLRGLEVDIVNSVQLSNHTGYGEFKGSILGGEDLTRLLEGLSVNWLTRLHTHVLTGYIGSESFLRAVVGLVDSLRRDGADVEWVCDPVIGDDGRCYVPEALISQFRSSAVPRATLLTPNQFEAEVLSGVTVRTIDDAFAALDWVHSRGCPSAVMTSSDLGGDEGMLLLGSCAWEDASDDRGVWPEGAFGTRGPRARFAVTIPRLRGRFTGTGDLTAALLLAHTADRRGGLPSACFKTVLTLQAVCKETIRWAESPPGRRRAEEAAAAAAAAIESGDGPKARVPPPELRLVAARASVSEPPPCEGVRLCAVLDGELSLAG